MGPPSLPLVIVIKHNTRVIVDYIKESCIPALFHIAQVNSTSPDTGISPSDFQSEASFRHMVKACPIGIQYTLEATGSCVGFTAIFPSEMCRSCRPISTRGFTVLDRKVHNMGLGQAGTRMVRPLAKHYGIPGHIARSSATNTLGVIYARHSGLIFQGWIPDSYQDADGKWHDELVTTGEFLSMPEVFQMTDEEVVSKCINDPLELMFSKVPFKGADIARPVSMPWIGQCLIKTATLDHIYPTYVTLYDAAKRGEGFGIDEFPSFNIFKDNFLKGRVVLELTRDSILIAVAVVGPSRTCKSPDPPSCSLYMLVLPEYRNHGVGTEFSRLIFGYIKDSGYTSILTDVLVTDNLPYSFLTRLGFRNVGCIPKSAYMAGTGYTDAILFYYKPETELSAAKL